MVNKLKEENKRLNESLDQNQNLNSKQNDHFGKFYKRLFYIMLHYIFNIPAYFKIIFWLI